MVREMEKKEVEVGRKSARLEMLSGAVSPPLGNPSSTAKVPREGNKRGRRKDGQTILVSM